MLDSGDVEGAGVLLRQFDKNNAFNQPWLPCPTDGPNSWCGKLSDRWSTVIVNALAPHLYSDYGGIVLDASAKLFCAYPEDGDSSHESKVCYDVWPPPPSPPSQEALIDWSEGGGATKKKSSLIKDLLAGKGLRERTRRELSWTREHAEEAKREEVEVAAMSSVAAKRLGPTAADTRLDGCIPGCMRKGQQCRDVGRAHNAYLCSFPPEQLQFAMEAQLQRESFTKRNNEMVVDLSSVTPRLPFSIEGFFYVKGSADYKEAEARDGYSAFMEYYKMDSNSVHAPPLMVVDMEKPRPFTLDDSLASIADKAPYGLPRE